MAGIDRLSAYPDISFIDATSFESLRDQMIADYEKRYKELTGKEISLAAADPYRLILYSCAVSIYQGYQYEDRAGKMGLLKYSTGEFLDNLAALKRVKRSEATPARTVIRFKLSTALERTATIPKGIRVKGQELYFETTQEGQIPAGSLRVDVPAVCQTAGKIGNGYRPGEITMLVDPLPFNARVSNTEATSGGTDRETDEELAERAYLAPSGYSTAGPSLAYEYHVRSYSTAIGECRIGSEKPGEVDIYIMVDGELPTEEFRKGLEEYLSDDKIRPLTDHVIVKAPEAIEYPIDFTYYIRRTDRDMEQVIRAQVETACQNYIAWQKRIGRDITPAQLISEVMKAGAQSVDVTQPVYQILEGSQIGIAKQPEIHYGGLRDG